jgi:SAM-dependent methyltransferase
VTGEPALTCERFLPQIKQVREGTGRGGPNRVERPRIAADVEMATLHLDITIGRLIDVKVASGHYRLLGDEARLRLLRLLSLERLNVTELTAVLGLAQSGVSRHLKLLKEAGFIDEQRSGGFSYYTLVDLREHGLGRLWDALVDQFSQASQDPAVKADHTRLQEVLRLRKENFREHAADPRDNRQLVPGRSWAAWSRGLGLLLPPLRVADLGCGDGYLTIELSRWAGRVVGIDRSSTVLARARLLAQRRRATNVTWKRGELEKLPLDTASFDLALLSQALHHAVSPDRALAEAVRILVPGGRLLILELREHEEEWVRDKLGDEVLGFSEARLRQLLTEAGLADVRISVGARKAGDPFAVLLALGHKPAATRTLTRRARKNS